MKCGAARWHAVRLIPGLVLPFDDLPERSVALDGVVLGRHFDPFRYRFSFDHHETPRFGLAATCEQVCDAIQMGFDPARLRHVLVNDVDRDVAAAVWLLLHPDRAVKVRERVIGLGRADSHGLHAPGAVPTPHFHATLPAKGSRPRNRDLLAAVDAVGNWLESGSNPAVSPPEPDLAAFAITCPEARFIPAPNGSAGLYSDGWTAFVLARKLGRGRWQYTYAKKSDFVPFDFAPVLFALNALEPGWGGASTVGGSPRATGSRLEPRELASLILRASSVGALGPSRH